MSLRNLVHQWFRKSFLSEWLIKQFWEKRAASWNDTEPIEIYKKLYAHLIQKVDELNPKTVHEFGCGSGRLLTRMEEALPEIGFTGSDFSSNQAQYTKNKVNRSEVECANITRLPFKDNQFDCTIGISVLMYLSPKHLDQAMQEFYRTSKQLILVEMCCKHLDDENQRKFNNAKDGRVDYDYAEILKQHSFKILDEYVAPMFASKEENPDGRMPLAIIVAER